MAQIRIINRSQNNQTNSEKSGSGISTVSPNQNGEHAKRGRGRPRIHPVRDDSIKRPVGRPPKNPPPPTNSEPKLVSTVPKPPQMYFNPKQAGKFIDYWKSIPDDKVDALTCHVYRMWPAIDRKLSNPDAKTSIDVIVGKCPFTSDDWESDVLHRYGYGDYRLILNEGSYNIAKAHVETRRDPECPPRLILKELVMGDPKNTSFLESLRMRGIKLPGDPGFGLDEKKLEEKEKEDMAEATAVETLSRIAEKVVNQPAPAPQPDLSGKVQLAGLELISDAARRSMEMVNNTAERLSETKAKESNPLELVESILRVADKFKPVEKEDKTSAALVDMFSQELRAMRTELHTLRNAPLQSSSSSQPKSLVDTLREMKETKELLGDVFGKREDDDDRPRRRRNTEDDDDDKPKKSTWENLAELAFKAIPVFIPALTQAMGAFSAITHNLAVMKSGQGTPVSVSPQSRPAPQGQQPSPQPTTPQAPALAAAMQDPEAAAFIASLPPDQQAAIESYHVVLSQYTNPLLHHLYSDQLNGEDFAEWLINSNLNGRQYYEQLKAIGKDSLTQIIRTYPPIWHQVRTTPQKFDEFLTRFMQHDEILAELDNEDDDGTDEDDENENEADAAIN